MPHRFFDSPQSLTPPNRLTSWGVRDLRVVSYSFPMQLAAPAGHLGFLCINFPLSQNAIPWAWTKWNQIFVGFSVNRPTVRPSVRRTAEAVRKAQSERPCRGNATWERRKSLIGMEGTVRADFRSVPDHNRRSEPRASTIRKHLIQYYGVT